MIQEELISKLNAKDLFDNKLLDKSPYLHMKGKNYNYLLVI